jgi:formaldehyde-activating enzyme involved in methanogenesis
VERLPRSGYQLPPLGHAPVLVVVQVRVTVAPAFVIVNRLPEAD